MCKRVKFVLFLFGFLSINVSSQVNKSLVNHFELLNKSPFVFQNSTIPKSLYKQQKTQALEWRLVSTKNFYNIAPNSANQPLWRFGSRDTFIYNSKGQQIVNKKSKAKNSWANDSISYEDSIVYDGGWKKEEFRRTYESFYDYTERTHLTYTYYNDHKTVVFLTSMWDTASNQWELTSKDSIVTAKGFLNDSESEIDNLISAHYFTYNSNENSWKEGHNTTIAINESTDTSKVFYFEGYEISFKYVINLTRTSLGLIKFLKTETYIKENLEGYVLSIISFNEYDSFGNLYTDKSYYFKTEFNQTTKDSMFYFYDRIYDSHGNNTVTILSMLNPDEKLEVSQLDSNFYTQLSVPVNRTKSISKEQNSIIKKSTDAIILTGVDLTAVSLLTLDGKLIHKASQKAANQMKINLLNLNKRIPSGIYMIKIVQKGNEVNATIKIDR